MKRVLFLLIMLVAGAAVGGGAGYAASRLFAPSGPAAVPAAIEAEADPHFVPAGHILAPLVGADGSLTGYVQFDVQLQVAEEKSEFVTARLPLLLHAINMRTYRTPMASGPDGMLPDLASFRKVAEAAAVEAFGAGVVRRVTITQATPV
jgi:hypothetical protein